MTDCRRLNHGLRLIVNLSLTLTAVALISLCGFGNALSGQQASTAGATSFREAETLLEQNRLAEAKTAVREGLSRNPSNVDGYTLLGIIESRQQDYTDAQRAFEQALHLAPRSAKTHNNLGNTFISEHQPDKAEDEFRTALRLDPSSREANYNLGLLLLAKGSAAEAALHIERAHPQSTEMLLTLARAYFEAKQPANAMRIAAEISAQGKDDAKAHFSLGVLLASQKQYKSAQVEFEKAAVLQPDNFEIVFNLGQTFLLNHDDRDAELQLAHALRIKPDSSQTMYLLAQVDRDESRPIDALDLLVQAGKLEPENTDIILLMAQITISQSYFEDAIPLLEKGIHLAPNRTDLRATLGEADFKSNQVDKAIDELTKVVAIDPTARSFSFLGLSYEYLGRFDEAQQSFKSCLKLDAHDRFCLFHLGYIAERQGDATAAEATFERVLRAEPNFADALFELANLRVLEKKPAEAEDLLRRYIRVGLNPASGYYRLAMVERSLNQTAAADRDLEQFQTLSKTASGSSYLNENLYDYLDNRSRLPEQARKQQDLEDLIDQNRKHPDQPELLYLLAAAYFKSGQAENAKSTIAQLDTLASKDPRTLAGTGVLLVRYRLLDEAIRHFQSALLVDPESDEIKFDLANAYFLDKRYQDALDTAQQITEQGRKDDACLALLGDIYAHLGDSSRAERIFRDAIARNPDNDQVYLSLALLQLRQNLVDNAHETLLKGQARIPASGKLFWGLGLTAVLQGNTLDAGRDFERAVEMLPEWPGSYAMLGVFYFETGQIDKSKEVLDRFKSSNAGGLDIGRIQLALERAPHVAPAPSGPMPMSGRVQLMQFALSLADRTL
jgi:tetratricopeptide (TPR) repeat protein